MINSRQKILNYILEQQSTTVEDLSKVFRVTPANIRHHLGILIKQGNIKIIGQKTVAHKGRPAKIYGTSKQQELNNLDQLAAALLEILKQLLGESETDQLSRAIASQISTGIKEYNPNPTRRMYSAVTSLNRMNYQAHWEAHVENPRIILGHCPYRQILDSHPELCQIDANLLENLLETPVTQIEKLIPNVKNIPQCVFLMHK